ncbi:MAG TPA: hypothetical protein VF173_18065 [Thermoanaerobaculia bacterium]|nr:hypothetical protein [Thermoanaerobaculia bacterium]
MSQKPTAATSGTGTANSTASLDTQSFDLSYDPFTGEFTLQSSEPAPSSQTGSITAGFQIQLSEPGIIRINTEGAIQISSGTQLGLLPFNTAGGASLSRFESGFVEIDVQALPTGSDVLGFVLFVDFTGHNPFVPSIETPPFFITSGSFADISLRLSYDQESGNFSLNHKGLEIPVERGQILLRLGTSQENSQGPSMTVQLSDTTSTRFVPPFAAFTSEDHATVSPESGPTSVTLSRDFAGGTGIGVSFVVQVNADSEQPCTIVTPDPIILDKQIGMGGDGGVPAS